MKHINRLTILGLIALPTWLAIRLFFDIYIHEGTILLFLILALSILMTLMSWLSIFIPEDAPQGTTDIIAGANVLLLWTGILWEASVAFF